MASEPLRARDGRPSAGASKMGAERPYFASSYEICSYFIENAFFALKFIKTKILKKREKFFDIVGMDGIDYDKECSNKSILTVLMKHPV
jgi:hypothetical protein